MKSYLPLLALLYLFFLQEASYAAPKKVLFVGNSITYFNDMPQVFRDIANQKGDSVDLTLYAPGGTGFQHHSVDPAVFDLFRRADWDIIVLQPGSNESVGIPPAQPRNITLAQGRKLIDSALFYNPCVRILIHEISYGVWGNSPSDVANYNGTMNEIRKTADFITDSTGLGFVPVGECLRFVWNGDPSVLLWQGPGDIHPNIKGSYLASCAFYAGIFHKKSEGSTVYNGNTPPDAHYYQRVADSILLGHSAQWKIDSTWHKADFTYTLTGNQVELRNTSPGSDSLVWIFNDTGKANTSTATFHFLKDGLYTIVLVAYFGPCADTVKRTLNLMTTNLKEVSGHQVLAVYPNPSSGIINLSLPDDCQLFKVRLFNAGHQLLQEAENESVLDIGGLARGLYLLQVENSINGKRFWQKVVVR